MYDAVVLAGGRARRLGGVDKPGIDIGGSSLLDRAVAAVAGAGVIACVGPTRVTATPVVWCREQPVGGGPVAALATGLAHTRAESVVVLAADLPGVAPAVPRLLTALTGDPDADAVALVDDAGRVNHLAAAWRRRSLTAALARLGDPDGAPMKALRAGIRVVTVADEGGWGRDCDTWDDVEAARCAPADGELRR